LDDVHPQPRELVRDLQLLLLVQRDARRLLAVAKRRVEDGYSVRHVVPFVVSSCIPLRLAAIAPPRVHIPLKGEQEKSQVGEGRHRLEKGYRVRTTLPTLRRSWRKRWASAPRSIGKAPATTGRT